MIYIPPHLHMQMSRAEELQNEIEELDQRRKILEEKLRGEQPVLRKELEQIKRDIINDLISKEPSFPFPFQTTHTSGGLSMTDIHAPTCQNSVPSGAIAWCHK